MTRLTLIRFLRRSAVMIIVVPSVACTTSGLKKLPVCDGKHLRDVNIYGSVLPGSPIPAVVEPPAAPPVPQIGQPTDGSVPPPPVPNAAGEKISVRADHSTFGSC